VKCKLTPEAVATILSSPESNGAMARQFGVTKQTISNIRLGYTHQARAERDDGKIRAGSEGRLLLSEQEAAVRAILKRSPAESHQSVAAALGLHRATVRKIRFGLQWPDVLPELDRLEERHSGAYCYRCTHWSKKGEGSCTLGIPEAALEGQLAARGCGAFNRRS